MKIMFLILNILTNYKVVWENTSFNIKLGENTHRYYDVPKAYLYKDDILIETKEYYEKGINHTNLSTVNSNTVRTHKIDYRVTFSNYNIKDTQTIYFNIIDDIPPTFIRIPTIERTLGSKKLTEKEITENILYEDNYYSNNELVLLIKGLDGVDINKPGLYELKYELLDPSNNITIEIGYYEVINNIPPEIIYKDNIVHNVFEKFNYLDYFKIKDKFDNNVKVEVDDLSVLENIVGIYPIYIIATNKDGLSSEVVTYINVVDTVKPELIIKPVNDLNVFSYNESYLKDIIISVSDNYDKLTIDDVKIEGYINFDELGTYKITYSVKDSSNNITSLSININIKDLKRPTINNIKPLNIDVFTKNINWLDYFNISDNYDEFQDLTYKINDKNVNFDIIGNYYIIIEVTDKSKNKVEERYDINIVDNISPIVYLIDDIVIKDFERKDNNFYKMHFLVEDNYSEYNNIDLEIISNVNYLKVGKYEATFIFKDESLNETIINDYIYIKDLEDPVLKLKSNSYKYYINDDIPNFYNFIQSISDNYTLSENLEIEIIDNINYSLVGLYTIEYYLYDESLNYDYKVINFYVDKHKKELITGEDIYIKVNEHINFYNYLNIDLDVVKIERYPKVVNTNIKGVKEVLHVAYDSRGNHTEFIQKIYVTDKFNIKDYSKNIVITVLGIISLVAYIYYEKKNSMF